jgi:hypothetical protein
MEIVAHKSPSNRAAYPRKSHGRSRVSNGHDLLPDIDGRSVIARRYRDIAGAILVDQGGIDQCSESRKQLVRRFAAAAVLAEQLEARLVNGEKIDIAEHATLSSTLVRLAQRIGIDRIPRDVTPPTVEAYLAAKAAAVARDTASEETPTSDDSEGGLSGDEGAT